MTKKTLSLFSAVVVASVVFTACSSLRPSTQSSPSPTPSTVITPSPEVSKKKTSYEFTASVSGQVALDLLQSNAQIETKDYGKAGKFVISINGLAGDNSAYWAFYLNGKYAEKGASQTILKKGDTIKFVYEAVAPTK